MTAAASWVGLDPTADPVLQWTAADDELHPAGSDRHDWTETTWWSFAVPERSLFGWLYCQVRVNNGTVAGGAFVYDSTARCEWELPYFAYRHYTPLPDPLDLRDVVFGNGVRVRVLEPGMRYAIGYRFREQEDFVADLEFAGMTAPVPHVVGEPPFTGSSHYDQIGRVTGTLRLHGETIAVDCLSMRDRSWGRRPELLGQRDGDRISYAYGATSTSEAFLAFCAPVAEDPSGDVERLTSGWLLRDGVLRRLTSAERRVERRPDGSLSAVFLHGEDADGRRLEARGEARSTMFLNPQSLCINTALRWDVDGREGFGEDQDVWGTARFAARLRAQRTP